MWPLFDILCYALFICFYVYIHVMLALRSVKVLLKFYWLIDWFEFTCDLVDGNMYFSTEGEINNV